MNDLWSLPLHPAQEDQEEKHIWQQIDINKICLLTQDSNPTCKEFRSPDKAEK